MKRVYCKEADATKWKDALSTNYILECDLKSSEVENGIVLPLRFKDDINSTDGVYEGGVCSQQFQFVAGIRRNLEKENVNVSCCSAYSVPEEELDYIDETVVFGGVVYHHFGDTLSQSANRLWYLADHPDLPFRYVFVLRPGFDSWFQPFFDLLGLTPDRMIIIDKPTRFKSIIVPDEACYILSGASKEWLKPFNLIRDNVRKKIGVGPYKKIYLSRTSFSKYKHLSDETTLIADEIGEEYYERFFERRGFHVVHPESIPFAEQVSIMMGAKEIVCPFGTLSHLALFADNGVKHTSIIKTNELWKHQLVIASVKELDWYYFEGTINPLPTSHDFGVFLFWPTKYFYNYLEDHKIDVHDDEIKEPFPDKDMVDIYIRLWADHFSQPDYYKRIRNKSVFDVVNGLHVSFGGEELERKEFAYSDNKKRADQQKDDMKKLNARMNDLSAALRNREKEMKDINRKYALLLKEVNQLQTKNTQLDNDNKSLNSRLQQVYNSKSWIITRPLRKMISVLRIKEDK